MKNKLIALAVTLLLGGSQVWAQAQQPATTAAPTASVKIGYTNMEYILQNMPESKDIQNQITIQRTQLEKNYQEMSKEFQDKLAAYEKGQAQMSDLIKADKEKELQGLQQRIQEFQANSSTQLQTKYNQLVNPVMQKIQKNIDAVAKESGFTFIFNLDAGSGTIPVLLYAPEENDVTELVFKKMGVALPSKQAAAQPAANPTTAKPTTPAPKKN
ncbi:MULTISPECIES: OmpH family outer membrane protein [Larkinella]|uniref:OmpH family outer membrane protein n=1 Tax=Larkinella punicea TaxID=2315727 RepID=A0A368JM55_9BACT|nr:MULTISPECIES: OmpH family outer membrane protein [Larkinella]RCR68740.1 OmpH family outer membrane protein [Larkinella punicea]